jgi:hypothetical protein
VQAALTGVELLRGRSFTAHLSACVRGAGGRSSGSAGDRRSMFSSIHCWAGSGCSQPRRCGASCDSTIHRHSVPFCRAGWRNRRPVHLTTAAIRLGQPGRARGGARCSGHLGCHCGTHSRARIPYLLCFRRSASVFAGRSARHKPLHPLL